MNRLWASLWLAVLLLSSTAVFAQETPITRYARFTGNINFVATGGSLRTESNSGNSCAVGASSSQALSGIPAGASLLAAYLYWGGSGSVPDTTVSLNGNTVTAQRNFNAVFTTGGTSYPFFGGFADVTAQVTGNGPLTFAGLTVNTGAPHCGVSAVTAGWSLVAIYGSPAERLRAVNVYDGMQFFRGSSLTLNPDGFRVPLSDIDGRMAIFALEGDPGNSSPLNGFSEALSFNGVPVDDGIVVPGSDPTIQPYDGTVNSLGVATSYGVDVDTFDVSALLMPGQTSATTNFSAGGDLVLLLAQVVSATSDPVVDLSLTKTHPGDFTVGSNGSYTLTVSNVAGTQREDNTVLVTDSLPAGLSFVSGSGTGWSCGASGQDVSCSHPPPLDPGNSLPPIVLTVSVSAAAAPGVTNTATVSSASVDIEPSNNSASNPTVVRGPDVSTSTKTVVDLNGGEPDPGDTLRYTITLLETGGIAASGVSVLDDLAADFTGLTIVSIPPGAVDASTPTGGANGTGQVDISAISVPASGTVAIVFEVQIAGGTAPGTPLNNAAVVNNPGGPGATPAAPQLIVSPSAIPSSGAKPLYLRTTGGNDLSRLPPVSDPTVTIAFGAAQTWTLNPPLTLPLALPAGNISVPLWLRRSGPGGSRRVQITLANSATGVIDSTAQTLSLPNSGAPVLANFVLNNAADTTFPAGSTFSLTVEQVAPSNSNRTTLIYPLGAIAGDFSRVVLDSDTVINVDSVETFDAAYSGGVPLAAFTEGEMVYVRAVVSDPFGSFDIAAANISIIDPATAVRVANAPMTMVADSGSATRIYEYAYLVPTGAPAGNWSAQVTGIEGTEAIVTHTRTGSFEVQPLSPTLSVQKTVAVINDPINGTANPYQIPGSVQLYRIAISNSGPGAVDASTLVIIDALPVAADLYVATGAGDPIVFVDGAPPSNLTYSFATDVSFSNQPGGLPPFDYSPVPDAAGFDANVTALRIAPSGSLAPATAAGDPGFSIEFRMRLR